MTLGVASDILIEASVVGALAKRAARHPHRTALLCGERRLTFEQLWHGVAAAACALAERGVRPGDRVLLDAPSTPAFVYGYFATHLAGGVAVPFDPHAPAARRDEIIRRTRPVLAFTAGPVAHAGACPTWPVAELERPGKAPSANAPPALESLADIMFTTGTTGRPKGVRLTHRNLAAAAAHVSAATGTREGDVNVVPLPLYHSFGLSSLRCSLLAGAAVVLVQGFRLPGEIFAALERHAATGLIGVPAGFALLLRFGERGLGSFSRQLRYLEAGSAPMPTEHKRLLMELLPRTNLFMHYGLTEASRSVFIEFHRDRARLDSVGLPAPGVRFEVRDEDGRPCRAGARGMLWIAGAHVSQGYWDDAELSAASFADGWMRTGDVGHVDADGYVHLHSRSDDMINVGGAKVAPDEVESVLASHPAVAEAACVAMPDPRGIAGHVVRAILVGAAGRPVPSDAELSRWAGKRLETYKIPARYEWVSVLPRTASGKLIRAALRVQAG